MSDMLLSLVDITSKATEVDHRMDDSRSGIAFDEESDERTWLIEDSFPPTRRGRATREKLIRSAEKLFRKNTYTDVSVSDIVERSDVSTGTFYRYFSNKEELFELLLSRVFWDMFNATQGVWDADISLKANFQQTTERYLQSYWRNRRLLASGYELASRSDRVRDMWWALRRDLYERMEVRLRQDQDASSLPPTDPSITMRALGCMVDEYARRAFAIEEYGSASEEDIRTASEVLGALWYRVLFGSEETKPGADHRTQR